MILIDRPSGLDCALRSPSVRAGTRLTQNLLYTFADYSCFVGKCLPTFRLLRKREGMKTLVQTLVLYRDRSGMTERRMRKETDRIGFDTAV